MRAPPRASAATPEQPITSTRAALSLRRVRGGCTLRCKAGHILALRLNAPNAKLAVVHGVLFRRQLVHSEGEVLAGGARRADLHLFCAPPAGAYAYRRRAPNVSMTSRAALLGGAKEDLEVERSEYEQDSGILTEGKLLVRSDTLRKRVLRLDESRHILLNALCGGGPLERAHTLNQRVRCLDESRHILRPRGRACTARARQQASRRVREARAWWREARGAR